MFTAGFLLGTVSGTVACLVTAVLHRLDALAGGDRHEPQRPALVPLHVSGVSRASLN